MYHGILQFDEAAPRAHLEMQTGDTVFFHPLLIHGSGMNRTEGFRKAISCHYASSHCQYIDVGQDDLLAREVNEIVKKRIGSEAAANISFQVGLRHTLCSLLCVL